MAATVRGDCAWRVCVESGAGGGLPSPGGTLTQAQRTVPPVESLSLRTVRIKVAIRHALGRAGHGAGRSRGRSRGGQRRGGGSVAWRGVRWAGADTGRSVACRGNVAVTWRGSPWRVRAAHWDDLVRGPLGELRGGHLHAHADLRGGVACITGMSVHEGEWHASQACQYTRGSGAAQACQSTHTRLRPFPMDHAQFSGAQHSQRRIYTSVRHGNEGI